MANERTRSESVAYLLAVLAMCEAEAARSDLATVHIQRAMTDASPDDVAMYALEIQHKQGHAAVSRDTARKCRDLLTEWGES